MADDNSEGQQNWRDMLPEDLKLHPSILKFKDLPTLGKSYVELERMMGSRIQLPDFEKGKLEDIEAFHKTWGRPEKATEYEFSELPKELPLDETFGNAIKGLAHELGLNKRQFSQLQKWGIQQSQGMMIEQEKEKENLEKQLKTEWGFRYNDNLEKAHKALAQLVGMNENHPFIKFLETSPVGDHPEFLKFLLEVGERFGEDKLLDTDIQRQNLDKDNARKRLNEIRADLKGPYYNENDPRHPDLIKEVNKLYETLYPKEA